MKHRLLHKYITALFVLLGMLSCKYDHKIIGNWIYIGEHNKELGYAPTLEVYFSGKKYSREKMRYPNLNLRIPNWVI